jgi:hypothetical protein
LIFQARQKWNKARYRCRTTLVYLQKCEWFTFENGFGRFYFKDVNSEKEILYEDEVMSLTISLLLQAPYGF